MTDHRFPLEGGNYRRVDGELVRDDAVPATESPTTHETGDAATAPAETSFFRRRSKSSED